MLQKFRVLGASRRKESVRWTGQINSGNLHFKRITLASTRIDWVEKDHWRNFTVIQAEDVGGKTKMAVVVVVKYLNFASVL